jgi:hypothetical protein
VAVGKRNAASKDYQPQQRHLQKEGYLDDCKALEWQKQCTSRESNPEPKQILVPSKPGIHVNKVMGSFDFTIKPLVLVAKRALFKIYTKHDGSRRRHTCRVEPTPSQHLNCS